MQQPIYQHNWTGALALYVTSPAQPLLNPAMVKGVSHNTKASKGTWLKAASHARLRLVEHQEQHEGQNSITALLELRLQENLLLQCPLLEQQLNLCIIPSSSTANSGSILVLRIKQQEQQQQQAPVWCFRFYDAPDCRSFKSALQALLSSMHSRTLQQQQQRQQQVEAAANTGPGTGAPQEPPGAGVPDAAAAAAADAAVAAGSSGGATGRAAVAAAGSPCAGAASAAHVKDLIKHYLLDPAFQSFVDQVDALWDEVEHEVMGDTA